MNKQSSINKETTQDFSLKIMNKGPSLQDNNHTIKMNKLMARHQ